MQIKSLITVAVTALAAQGQIAAAIPDADPFTGPVRAGPSYRLKAREAREAGAVLAPNAEDFQSTPHYHLYKRDLTTKEAISIGMACAVVAQHGAGFIWRMLPPKWTGSVESCLVRQIKKSPALARGFKISEGRAITDEDKKAFDERAKSALTTGITQGGALAVNIA